MKPERACIDAAWRASARLVPCSVAQVSEFILAHYLHRRPGVVTLCLRVHVRDAAVGAIVFALPPRETATRYGGLTWELARLYLRDDVPANAETWTIARSIRYIKRHHPDVRFVVSYADPSAGHAGVIYKAANFVADGMTDEGRKTARADYQSDRQPDSDLLGLGKPKRFSRKAHVVGDVTRVARVSKHRFVMAVSR